MTKARQTIEVRWVVARDYYSEAGDNMIDEFPILYGTEAEANDMLNRLNAGSDKSFFDPADEEAGFLFVDQHELVFDGRGNCRAA